MQSIVPPNLDEMFQLTNVDSLHYYSTVSYSHFRQPSTYWKSSCHNKFLMHVLFEYIRTSFQRLMLQHVNFLTRQSTGNDEIMIDLSPSKSNASFT